MQDEFLNSDHLKEKKLTIITKTFQEICKNEEHDYNLYKSNKRNTQIKNLYIKLQTNLTQKKNNQIINNQSKQNNNIDNLFDNVNPILPNNNDNSKYNSLR